MSADPARPWLVLTGLALGVTVTNGFARFAYGLILPAMKSELGWTYAQAGWLNTANAIGYVIGAVATMLLIGRIGPTRLFSFGLVTTTVALLATGVEPALWWQSLWRILAGIFGAMSFATAGTLTARLFSTNPRLNALAIALLFGSGGGLGIVLTGAVLPMFIATFGNAAWPWAWIMVGMVSAVFAPLGLWAAKQLDAPMQQSGTATPLPVRRMLPEMMGYAGFGLGYIVYLTFLSAWMLEQSMSVGLISIVWITLGLCLSLSPFVWRGVFARYASGVPLAMILIGIAAGSALPVIWPTGTGLLVSALVFGLSVFMAPGAVTNFTRQNLPPESWGSTISLFTVIFAIAQTIGPYAAGLLGDHSGSIGVSLLAAAAVLTLGAAISLLQKPLDP